MPFNRFTLLFLAFIPCAVIAATPTLQDANQLFRQGQNVTALKKVDAYLASNPKDAQGRFLKGLILTELNRYQDAIKVFTDLTEDYPELPEPYNNLAVLYAAQGQYDKARKSLEQAIRTHPSYATAHENLGDIYAKMASMAYDKAFQLDRSNTSAKTKLALIKEIFSPTHVLDTNKPAEKAAAASAAAAPTPAAGPAGGKPNDNATAPSSSSTASQTQPAEHAKAISPAEAKAAVKKTVMDWAAAWSRKDVKAYLSFYADDFDADGVSRSDWEVQRRTRLEKPRYIRVKISRLRIDVEGDKATAKFHQRYESNTYRDWSHKTLTLVKEGDAWKITREQ
jgi:tetratricopeptide (TPR) repeat protein